MKFTSQSWFLEFTASAAEVVDFYHRSLPDGATPVEAEEGAVAFKWIPGGAVEGESVTVTLRKSQLQLGETEKAKGES